MGGFISSRSSAGSDWRWQKRCRKFGIPAKARRKGGLQILGIAFCYLAFGCFAWGFGQTWSPKRGSRLDSRGPVFVGGLFTNRPFRRRLADLRFPPIMWEIRKSGFLDLGDNLCEGGSTTPRVRVSRRGRMLSCMRFRPKTGSGIWASRLAGQGPVFVRDLTNQPISSHLANLRFPTEKFEKSGNSDFWISATTRWRRASDPRRRVSRRRRRLFW